MGRSMHSAETQICNLHKEGVRTGRSIFSKDENLIAGAGQKLVIAGGKEHVISVPSNYK